MFCMNDYHSEGEYVRREKKGKLDYEQVVKTAKADNPGDKRMDSTAEVTKERESRTNAAKQAGIKCLNKKASIHKVHPSHKETRLNEMLDQIDRALIVINRGKPAKEMALHSPISSWKVTNELNQGTKKLSLKKNCNKTTQNIQDQLVRKLISNFLQIVASCPDSLLICPRRLGRGQ